ncbi:M14 family metallopeptidase [Natronorarus salvus]|uniref:succinylglutamate desuccinylase/aspartoacylase domain-containing protein n=1 Tax=Natronorarus salvus TaxID=3117733 RepID=UPI002F25F9B0
MRVEQLGSGVPEIAVVGGIHGDEPCGIRAIERILDASPSVERPVKFIVANELAAERGKRYLDIDLNRAFPGEQAANTHEGRLAYDLAEELEGCATLALHSTQSTGRAFAIADGVTPFAERVVPSLSVETLVTTGELVQGRLFTTARTIEVECGLQGSDRATETATRIVHEFLATMGVLHGDSVGGRGQIPVFELRSPIPKEGGEEYDVLAENFEPVGTGEPFASIDGRTVAAEVPFYPVLLSPYGYREIFGYAAEQVGVLGS